MSTWPSEGVSVVIYSGTFVWLQKKIDPLIQEKRCSLVCLMARSDANIERVHFLNLFPIFSILYGCNCNNSVILTI